MRKDLGWHLAGLPEVRASPSSSPLWGLRGCCTQTLVPYAGSVFSLNSTFNIRSRRREIKQDKRRGWRRIRMQLLNRPASETYSPSTWKFKK